MRTSKKAFTGARKANLNIRNYLPHMVLAAMLMLVPLFIAAATNGIIKGVVIDGSSKQPVVGASVQLEGTSLGAKTDRDGRFTIINIPPGAYNLMVSCLGYDQAKVLDIDVVSDSTSDIKLSLNPAVVDLGQVIQHPADALKALTTPNESGTVRQESEKKQAGRSKDSYGDVNKLQHTPSTGQSCIISIPRPTPPPTCPPPAHGGSAIVNGQAYDAMFFQNYGVNPFVDAEDDHLSTFAADVDDASYVLARSYLERGELPPAEAIRVEEFINHFNYHYTPPNQGPFAVHIEGAAADYGRSSHLLRIGIKGMEIDKFERASANLIFVIDVSGSMAREDRLELVKRSLTYLVDELEGNDRIGIVVYGSYASVLLEPTPAGYRNLILDAIHRLTPGGSTNAEDGLRLGYAMAARHLNEERINRVILCSDGVANVGNTSPEVLAAEIKRYAKMGITLSTIGVGMGNYNDVLMEQLADNGDGKYAYVDDLAEARRIFIENLTGNLQIIARDVKIQVDFNPAVVRSWRLLGYENRDVADEQFRDNRVDGGEVGAGHQVTALYEVKLTETKRGGDIGTVYVRYKNPETFRAGELSRVITRRDMAPRCAMASGSFRLAAVAAQFAEILKKSYWTRGQSLGELRATVREMSEDIYSSEVKELLTLIDRADRLWDERVER